VNREIEAEQEKVAEQDAIDAIDTGDESAIRFQQSLDQADVRHAELMKSVEGWLCTVLGFGKDPYTPVSGSVKYRAERSTLVPANEVRSRFGPFLDRPGTYDRSVAAKHPEVALYRPGEGLIDALAEYIEWDDRGRAFAMWRQEPTWDSREGSEWVGFRFDVLLEADTRPAKEVLAQLGEGKTSPRALDRQADALFAPMTETVFVNAALQEVTDSELLSCLRRPFSKDMDHNLTKARVSVIEAVVARDVWDTFCRQARDAALRMVRERPTLRFACEEAAALAARKLAVRMERLRLRTIQSSIIDQRELLPGALKLEQDVGEALIKGIQQPRVRLDAIGFIVLSGRRPFTNNDSREAFQ
jgi:ATP-dependent helicase HepA